MRILFSMRHAGALRNFASTVRELSRRGHEIHLAFMIRDEEAEGGLLQQLVRDHATVTFERVKTRPHRWSALARTIRSAGDYARYLQPEFSAARPLRKRAARHVAPWLRKRLDLQGERGPAAVRWAIAAFDRIERALPPAPGVVRFLQRVNPDVLLVTPLIDLASDQVEYVKAARLLGIRSALCVHSWDNLTNKGLIHSAPDRVFVWNAAQQREAATLHGVDASRVIATGAPVFDDWFTRTPSTTREEFCRRVGLPADRPFFLYLCSSRFIAATEADFIVEWIAAVRKADDPRVRQAGLLIRPHPRTTLADPPQGQWADFADVAVWPRAGANPVDAASKSDYFDSIFHAAAAIGINTTAQIEAGIIGRAVYSMRAPQFSGTQEGSLHFQYLLKESGGLVRFDQDLDAHTRALADALDAKPDTHQRLRHFVHGFVRPHGLDVPATPRLADDIESLARIEAPSRMSQGVSAAWRRAALYPLAVAARLATPADRG
jgi:hypothetical protein